LKLFVRLTVALAKDLHQEFYPHYEAFLSRLIALLDTKDTDQLEWTFECLAYLFKFLWRLLVNNLPTVFEALLPLLGSSKPYYINNFAAESFAFVARKIKDQRKFVKLVLRSLKKFPDVSVFKIYSVVLLCIFFLFVIGYFCNVITSS
jgi:U3 small nucleolar RNA-associated protein 20